MTLRHKLLVVAASALIIPVGGWYFLGQMDSQLRAAREQALLASAQTLARSLERDVALPPGESWYLQRGGRPITVDGFGEDWSSRSPWAQQFSGAGALLLAELQGRTYGYASVEDTSRTRPSPSAAANQYDHLDLVLGLDGALCRYRIAAAAPGPLAIAPLAPAAADCPDPLRAAWQENGSGYRVEWQVAAPIGRLGIAARDAGAKPAGSLEVLPLLRYSGAWSAQLRNFLPDHARARLLSRDGWVLADTGLRQPDESLAAPGRLAAVIYRLFIAGGMQGDSALDGEPPRVQATEAWQALSGIAATSWYRAEPGDGIVLTAAVPLPGPGNPRGAVVLGQLQPAMPLLANPGLFWLLLACFVLLLVGGVLLAVFAIRLGTRMARLSSAAERASAHQGGLDPMPELSGEPDDELGDLARSHARLLGATGGYAEYLRSLASKLSHELQTPLAVVTSSLDNLDAASLPEADRTYVARAREGAARLGALVKAMGASSRVERALAAAEPEDFDLRALVAGCADGYRLLAGDRRFDLALPAERMPLHGAPDLVAQALDKLFDNALSFSPEDGWIALSLRAHAQGAEIALANHGPPLPESERGRLFDSLVSVRGPEAGGGHLGLGLYIARLVALRHGGGLDARNLTDGTGVEFTLRLVAMPRQSIADAGGGEAA